MAETRSFPPMDAEALGAALIQLRDELAFPLTPDLVAPVARRIRAERPSGWRSESVLLQPGWLRFRRSALLAIVLLLLAVGVAVGLGLGLAGLRIVPVSSLPPTTRPSSTPAGPLGSELGLGELTTIDAARSAVPFTVRVPTDPAIGAPETVYLGRTPPTGRVELVYRARPGLSSAGPSGVGLLVTQFQGETDPEFIQKMVGPGTRLELVDVGGSRGFWISGRPHVIVYRRAGTDLIDQEVARLVGNALIWQRNGVIYRIESTLSKQDALRIAESLR